MITVFTIPKPFMGHVGTIQRNAMCSWKEFLPGSDVIVFGDEFGVAEACREIGTRHVPDVERNQYGTPLVGPVFDRVQEMARHDPVCYVNADIMITSDFLTVIKRLPFGRYLMIGSRQDVELREFWDFGLPDSERRLKDLAFSKGTLHPFSGSDYFVFPNGTFRSLLPFAVGRPGWDNWLIYRARMAGIPVVDVSPSTLVIHQNHDHVHVRRENVSGEMEPERAYHYRLMARTGTRWVLPDPDWVLGPRGIRKRLWSRCRLYKGLMVLPFFHPWLTPIAVWASRIQKRHPGFVRALADVKARDLAQAY